MFKPITGKYCTSGHLFGGRDELASNFGAAAKDTKLYSMFETTVQASTIGTTFRLFGDPPSCASVVV